MSLSFCWSAHLHVTLIKCLKGHKSLWFPNKEFTDVPLASGDGQQREAPCKHPGNKCHKPSCHAFRPHPAMPI